MKHLKFVRPTGPGRFRGRPTSRPIPVVLTLLAIALFLSVAFVVPSAVAQPCPNPNSDCGKNVASPSPGTFPRISWVDSRDSLRLLAGRSRGFAGVIGSQGQDSTVSQTVTLEWHRDLALEQTLLADTPGGGFGGYNIFRVFTDRDTCQLELVRRFVFEDTLLWHWTDEDTIVSFVDSDSAGNLVKICRPAVDPDTGENLPQSCPTPGDSVFVLLPPPPPADGFPVYYSIMYAADPSLIGGGFENRFVPDVSNNFANCTDSLNVKTCCNVNHLALNLMTTPILISGPVEDDLERITVVPNPYRGSEAWDPLGQNRVEFRGLPQQSKIEIYTVAGDLVRVLDHTDPLSGSEDWDLKNANGDNVTSGIYMFRVTAPPTGSNPVGFEFQYHFVVIR